MSNGEPVEVLGQFDHHPDPAIDFEIEVEALQGLAYNQSVGMDLEMDLPSRIERALAFRVGGATSCIAAKALLRQLATSP